MNGHKRIIEIFKRGKPDRQGFWLGMPSKEAVDIYSKQLLLNGKEELEEHFDSDCYFVCGDLYNSWKCPAGKPAIWDFAKKNKQDGYSQPGMLTNVTSLKDVEKIDWPDPAFLDYSEALIELKKARYKDKAILSGSWSHFFHLVTDLFGIEQYLINLYSAPGIVEAVTERVVDFFVAANERFCEVCGDYFDVLFFGNDLGSQKDLLLSPEMFQKFVLPGIQKIAGVAKKHNKFVMLHSCGSIIKIIPFLIDAGVDALHPLQARAFGMNAENLAKNFKGQVSFAGGVDTQNILVNYTPEQVKQEVRRLKAVFGEHYIISPSHEAILPDVPLANVEAMVSAAKEYRTI